MPLWIGSPRHKDPAFPSSDADISTRWRYSISTEKPASAQKSFVWPRYQSWGSAWLTRPQLRRFMETFSSAFDFVEVVPDVAWNDIGPGPSVVTCLTRAQPRSSRRSAVESR